jgi:hypothetical protein
MWWTKKFEYGLLIMFILLCTACSGAGSSSSGNKQMVEEEKTPPYYGTFLKIQGRFVEIPLGSMGGGNFESSSDIPTTSDSQPIIYHWHPNVDLNNLLFGDLDSGDIIAVTVTPKEDGVLEIQPRSPLYSGTYCFVQGDPLAFFLNAWCFSVSN